MPVPPQQEATAAMLTRLAGAPPIETHISLVFIGADTVWKLKKAVKLPFLDFTRVEDRRRFAERELALNAPAAPGLYRDVLPVVRQQDGSLTLAPAATDAPAEDWVLRMAPVPAGDFLDAIAAGGGLTRTLQDALADAVAAYHRTLPPLEGVLPPMRQIALGNVPSALGAGLPVAAVEAWRDDVLAALHRLDPLLAERAGAGFVRRAHGDLHLGNLCLWQGRPVPFDALEFDETFATIDLAYDLAFLLMDLDRRVDRAAANRVLNRYVARTGDVGLVPTLPAFLSLRAMVRAHVEARSGHAAAWQPYLQAALDYLRTAPAMVVAVGGLPGTGKSTLARALAPGLGRAPGALILRSDEIRKRQHGVAPEQRLPQSAYGDAASQAVFAAIAEGVRVAAAGGHCVVADATFIDPAHRRAVEDAARRAGVGFAGFWLEAPLPELERRIVARSGDASDATLAVLHAVASAGTGAGSWRPVDSRNVEAALALARATLRCHIVPC
ncbi:MAG TPA: AAA family ATPase [Acetobacteraceae bacterium]|nr:AAA family ATPase [Acetobacteraceae bacterium]